MRAGAGLLRWVNRTEPVSPDRLEAHRGSREPALFRAFPPLGRSVPWRPLGSFPTPVAEVEAGEGDGAQRLLVKQDDRSSLLYGGSKVRKLEHLLAEAELAGRGSLVTLGGLGSHHALATAVHGSRLGFEPELVLYPQPVTPEVEGAVRAFLGAGARLRYREGHASAAWEALRVLRLHRREGREPYLITFGGSQRLGVLGFVGAALELAEQVERGECPPPDRIFVPLGTAGTAAGLVAGLRLAGLRCRLSAVRVATGTTANRFLVRRLARDAVAWLRSLDPSVPEVRIEPDGFEVVTGYMGPGYGVPTAEAREALERFGSSLTLETTYTAKALAACLDHLRSPASRGETVLFWQTCSAVPGPRAPSLEGAPLEVREALRDGAGGEPTA